MIKIKFCKTCRSDYKYDTNNKNQSPIYCSKCDTGKDRKQHLYTVAVCAQCDKEFPEWKKIKVGEIIFCSMHCRDKWKDPKEEVVDTVVPDNLNNADTIMERQKMKGLLLHRSKIHENCIRLNPTNSKEHEMKKVELCWDLLKAGKTFITEAEFETGGRADIFSLDEQLCYEIVKSESDKSLEEKAIKYPVRIIKIKVG